MSREPTLRTIIDRQDRACVDVDASVFYPRHRIRGAIDYAKRICACCPIATECRDYAASARPRRSVGRHHPGRTPGQSPVVAACSRR